MIKTSRKKTTLAFLSSECLSPEKQITKQINLEPGTFPLAAHSVPLWLSLISFPHSENPFPALPLSLRKLLKVEKLPFDVTVHLIVF